jgi:ABC-type antimicrobial peptide transport system permease subunit
VALGAPRGAVVLLVMKEMLVVILLGVIAGAVAAYACGSYVEAQLFGVKAADPFIFAISAGTLMTAALTAALVPAWRAARISPLRALRFE